LQKTYLNLNLKQFPARLFAVVLFISVPLLAAQAGPAFKTIQNTGGGTIVYGPLSGQLSFQAALSETLKQVTSDDLAGALEDTNPNRFETVPLSQYRQGLDF